MKRHEIAVMLTTLISAGSCDLHRSPLDARAPALSSANDGGVATGQGCNDKKFGFTQATGRINDGAIEFCVADDAALRAAIVAIAPMAAPQAGTGRIACTTQRYEFPTPQDDSQVCTAPHGALTDAAWSRLCQLAELSLLTTFQPTFRE